jgi:hypothetical protein
MTALTPAQERVLGTLGVVDAYELGRRHQRAADQEHLASLLADLATAHADIDVAWKRLGRTTREARIRSELAEMRRNSRSVYTSSPSDPVWHGLGARSFVYKGGRVPPWTEDRDGS